jgi:hypothetical protein
MAHCHLLTHAAQYTYEYTVKKSLAIFPARESLVSDIPAGDWKSANLFYGDTLYTTQQPVLNSQGGFIKDEYCS